MLVSGVSDLLGEMKVPALDLAMYYDEISQQVQTRLQTRFESMGLALSAFFIENISLPEEVEKVVDKRTSMGVLGDLQQYTRYQAAEAIREAARNPGSGLAGAGIGLGAGAALGQAMNEALNGIGQRQDTAGGAACPYCKTLVPQGGKFCANCGKPLKPPKTNCMKCGFEMDQGLKFCPECGTRQAAGKVCPGCGKEVSGVKFCPECGSKLE
jgi:membrane protease subunit (stomatin/prohibitin family)